MNHNQFDFVFVGGGIGSLLTGAYLAKQGKKVLVTEKHYEIGGYGHSFKRKEFDFCAQLHYIWNCLPGEPGADYFKEMELDIPFTRFNPEGFDHIYYPDGMYKIVKGVERNIKQLAERFPGSGPALIKYFSVLDKINDQMIDLPLNYDFWTIAKSPLKYRHLVRYYGYTLQKLFDELEIPSSLQTILAGQSGNLLSPPEEVSLFIHAGMVIGYDKGACVPTYGFRHLMETLQKTIDDQPESQVMMKTEVQGLIQNQGKVLGVTTKKGEQYFGHKVIINADPKVLRKWLPQEIIPSSFDKKLNYTYSTSNLTIYLALKDIDLTKYGFGDWNIWSYAKNNINEVYRDQLKDDNLQTPSYFISTPTLHHGEHGNLAPEGHEQMVICTMCRYQYFKDIKDKKEYNREKERVADIILNDIEKKFGFSFKDKIALKLVGSPTTNERFVSSPLGNAYGADLTPYNYRLGKIKHETPFENLYLIGAVPGVPSFAGGLHYAHKMAKFFLDQPNRQ